MNSIFSAYTKEPMDSTQSPLGSAEADSAAHHTDLSVSRQCWEQSFLFSGRDLLAAQ